MLSHSGIPGKPHWKSGAPAWSKRSKTLPKWLQLVWAWTVLHSPKLGDTGKIRQYFCNTYYIPYFTIISVPTFLLQQHLTFESMASKTLYLLGFIRISIFWLFTVNHVILVLIFGREIRESAFLSHFPRKANFFLYRYVESISHVDKKLLGYGFRPQDVTTLSCLLNLTFSRQESSWSIWLVDWSKQGIMRLS